MNHKPHMKTKNTIIKQTKDYSKFVEHETNPANRKTNKALLDSMKRHGWLASFPMSCVPDKSGKLKIVDGHRRFSTATKLGIPVRFVEGNGDFSSITPSEISALTKPWTVRDHAESYAKLGDKGYQTLLAFCDKHQVGISAAGTLLCKLSSVTQVIPTGKFKVSSVADAEEMVSVMRAVRGDGERPRFDWWKHQRFAAALVLIQKFCREVDFSKLAAKCKSHPAKLDNQPSTEHFIAMLEAIYNYRLSGMAVPIGFMVRTGIANNKHEAKP